jgi:hypothetical protein
MIEVFSSNKAVAIFIPDHADFRKDVWKHFACDNAIFLIMVSFISKL